MSQQDLRQAIKQVLENYRRCGIQRFNRSESFPWAVELVAAVGNSVEAVSELPGRDLGEQPSDQALPKELSGQPQFWDGPALGDARRQETLEQLNQKVVACRQCAELCGYRQRTVFGSGPLRPTVCFMGEAPGADEDRSGLPFVGAAGQLLTRIIAACQLRREEVYILNALKCRPPNNRTPADREIANCRPFLEAQLEVLQPKYIVCLGAVAVRSLLGTSMSIGRLRGKIYQYRGAQVIVTYHPSYLLRQQQAKRLVWEDMQMLMRELGISAPPKT
jgi:uracil-DNA glycosylase